MTRASAGSKVTRPLPPTPYARARPSRGGAPPPPAPAATSATFVSDDRPALGAPICFLLAAVLRRHRTRSARSPRGWNGAGRAGRSLRDLGRNGTPEVTGRTAFALGAHPTGS